LPLFFALLFSHINEAHVSPIFLGWQVYCCNIQSMISGSVRHCHRQNDRCRLFMRLGFCAQK